MITGDALWLTRRWAAVQASRLWPDEVVAWLWPCAAAGGSVGVTTEL